MTSPRQATDAVVSWTKDVDTDDESLARELYATGFMAGLAALTNHDLVASIAAEGVPNARVLRRQLDVSWRVGGRLFGELLDAAVLHALAHHVSVVIVEDKP